MRSITLPLLLVSLLAVPALAQKRTTKKDPDFPEAVEQAKKAYDAKEYGTAVSALQAALKAVQKLQRTALLAALPKPEGFTFKDEDNKNDEANPFTAGVAALGLQVTRHYEKGDKHIDVEVMANSPMVSMLAMMFNNPAIVKADGGEMVEYGQHKAILKKNGDDGQELTILLYDKHTVKVTVRGLSADELLAVFDQAAVDKLDKQLGK